MMRRAMTLAACALLAACGSDDDGGGVTTIAVAGSPASPPTTTLIAGAPTLTITAAGPVQGTDYDTMTVAGTAALSGNLQLEFANGYKPTAGQRFVVLTAVGGRTGFFGAVNTQGLGYSMEYDANTVTVVMK